MVHLLPREAKKHRSHTDQKKPSRLKAAATSEKKKSQTSIEKTPIAKPCMPAAIGLIARAAAVDAMEAAAVAAVAGTDAAAVVADAVLAGAGAVIVAETAAAATTRPQSLGSFS